MSFETEAWQRIVDTPAYARAMKDWVDLVRRMRSGEPVGAPEIEATVKAINIAYVEAAGTLKATRGKQ